MGRADVFGAPPGYGELGPVDRETQQPYREKEQLVFGASDHWPGPPTCEKG